MVNLQFELRVASVEADGDRPHYPWAENVSGLQSARAFGLFGAFE